MVAHAHANLADRTVLARFTQLLTNVGQRLTTDVKCLGPLNLVPEAGTAPRLTPCGFTAITLSSCGSRTAWPNDEAAPPPRWSAATLSCQRSLVFHTHS